MNPLEEYGGWIGLAVYFLVREVWPFLRDKAWPERSRQERSKDQRYRQLEEIQLDINKRQVEAMEYMSKVVNEMTVAIVTNNERLSQLSLDFAGHAAFVQTAITDMRVKIASEK